jgi:hypothetical protein
MTTEPPLTFTNPRGLEGVLEVGYPNTAEKQLAQLPDLIAALTPRGYAVVKLGATDGPFVIEYEDGGYDEFTREQIERACAERGYAVVPVLGAEPTREELVSLREWLASWGDGANHSDPTGATVPIAKATLERLLAAALQQRTPGVAEGAAGVGDASPCPVVPEARTSRVAPSGGDIGESRARTLRLLLRQADEARAKLAERTAERDAAFRRNAELVAENEKYRLGMQENCQLRSQLDQQRSVVEAAREVLPDYEDCIDVVADHIGEDDDETVLSRQLARSLRDALSSAGSSSPQDGEPRCAFCNLREHAYSKGGSCYRSLSGMHSFDEPDFDPGSLVKVINAIGKGGSGSVDAATREDAGAAPSGSTPSNSIQPEPPAPAKCPTCDDTHQMQLGERTVMCTRCPTPCEHCQAKPQGPYCATTPCSCECHSGLAPKPATATFPALPIDADDEAVVDAMMAKRQGEARPLTRREPETANSPESPDGSNEAAEVGTSGDTCHECGLPWHVLNGPRVYDSFGGLVATFSTLADAELAVARCNATKRAEPDAQGVSRERVERLAELEALLAGVDGKQGEMLRQVWASLLECEPRIALPTAGRDDGEWYLSWNPRLRTLDIAVEPDGSRSWVFCDHRRNISFDSGMSEEDGYLAFAGLFALAASPDGEQGGGR